MESMRYRDYKNFYKGGYFHIYNRGNNKQIIFIDDSDYWNFLVRFGLAMNIPTSRMPLGMSRGILDKKLKIKPLPEKSFSILAYCLMPNHFHFLIRQNTNLSIAKLFAKVCTSYSMYFNKKYSRVGGLFQDQFKAKLVENDKYLTYVSAYIHNNPKKPKEYQYSSYGEYLQSQNLQFIETGTILKMFQNKASNYEEFIDQNKSLDDAEFHA